MNFISCSFFVFFIVFFALYYIVRPEYRYVLIFIGSYFFYGWCSVKMLPVLIISTVITYIGGRVIEINRSRLTYACFFLANICILLFYKYAGVLLQNIISKEAFAWLNAFLTTHSMSKIIMPVGLSFYVFQSTTYLGDIYRKGMQAERNFVRYAAFVSFFPTILSGPIQKSRELLPQLKMPCVLDFDSARKGLVLFVWGCFEKLCVSNKLLQIVNAIYDNYWDYWIEQPNRASYYLVAAVCFSVYIYSDFSAYSDMSRGISKLLGIEVGRNFKNPYLSTSLAEFWTRWHVSLNDWFVENIYIPLGGSRRGNIRKYINIFVIFFVSGLWHGATWNFLLWGIINGLLVIIGHIIRPLKTKFYSVIKVDESVESVTFIRRIIVFWIITLTWVFFKNDANVAFDIVRQLLTIAPVRFFVPSVFQISGSTSKTLCTAVFTILFCLIQYCRKDEENTYLLFKKQPIFIQSLILAVVICICTITAMASSVTVNTEFLYFNF